LHATLNSLADSCSPSLGFNRSPSVFVATRSGWSANRIETPRSAVSEEPTAVQRPPRRLRPRDARVRTVRLVADARVLMHGSVQEIVSLKSPQRPAARGRRAVVGAALYVVIQLKVGSCPSCRSNREVLRCRWLAHALRPRIQNPGPRHRVSHRLFMSCATARRNWRCLSGRRAGARPSTLHPHVGKWW